MSKVTETFRISQRVDHYSMPLVVMVTLDVGMPLIRRDETSYFTEQVLRAFVSITDGTVIYMTPLMDGE